MATAKNTFSKQQRLKSRKKLQELFTSRKRIYAGNIKLQFLIEDDGIGEVKCGVGLSGRNFKKAVDRNRIKRLLREAYRLQQHSVNDIAVQAQKQISIFFVYQGKELPDYQYIFYNIGIALKKLLKHINEAVIKNT
ncbi:MAG: ribonuclease P protein component [Sphingobacteriales bacterium]|nr:ribonuclease P protein component [Sphingobacteriales bacterium]